jgi:hypothetical protein
VTYRSHLGAVDPRAAGVVRLGRRVRVRGEIGRATFSNDRWIRADLLNSFTTLVAGVDTRNYFRADRGEARVERVWETPTATYTPMVGARVEHAWSTGPDSFTTTAPFTITGRDDRERILRPNPRVRRGHVASALAGGRVEWESPQGFELQAGVLLEQAFRTPGEADPFTQFTGHVDLAFPTFGTQHFDLTAHAVASGGAPPPQRWAWLGGNGTILTLDLLELGGDQLAYVESRYHIPIDRVRIPIAGPPVITLRHIIGSAGVGSLPTLVQNVGARLTVAVVRLDYVIDPATRRSSADISFAMPF